MFWEMLRLGSQQSRFPEMVRDMNVSKLRIFFGLLAISVLSIFWIAPVQAQAEESGWSASYRLSSTAGRASEGFLVADRYGYVHCFWAETLFENGQITLKYARFDGVTWSKPNDIYVAGQDINNVSPVVDQQGILHIIWSEGLIGRTYYTYAPANSALSVQNWAKPIQIKIPARPGYLRVDSRGIFHIVYINPTEESGVYYVRSEDKGTTWSEPNWLDPDIPPDHIPDSLNFELDENDGLHAVWWYGGLNRAQPDLVRYAHALDGGHTWSTPMMMDQVVAEHDHFLDVASPKMIVQGETVHVIWAAGRSFPYRYHSFSTDAGRTWSAPVRIFGELHGQAFDGLAVDGAGRVHFFGQIRYPMGIYHAYWDQTRWSKPSLVYLIAEEGAEADFDTRVHAHHTLPVIRAGNQLVLTFADGPADPNRRLFVTYRTLDDIAPLKTIPTPTPTATLIPPPSPTPSQPEPMATATATVVNTPGAQPLESAPRADSALQFGLVPVLLLLGGTFIFWLWYKNNS